MAGTLWAATRKGLFRLEYAGPNQPGRIAHTTFLGEPVTMMLPDARDGSVYAALNLGHFGVKMHRSTDGGTTWTEIATPAYPKTEAGDGPSLVQIWSLEPAGPDANDGLWAGTLPGGLFYSADRGASWSLNMPLWERPERQGWFGGGYDVPGIHSICVDPRDRRHVLVGVSCGGVWRTRDGGESWSQTANGMIADYMPPPRNDDPNIQDPHRMVQCPTQPDALWAQHHNGIFRTTDNATTWQRVTTMQPSAFGFAVVVHPEDGETAWFVPAIKDERRVPVDGKLVVTRTRNGGRNCEILAGGLPDQHCFDLVYRHALDVDATGRVLAMGSTTGHLWTSFDAGESWHQLPHHLPPIYALRFAAG
jgi:photosystem II stability/assembly factor-like uncharacterized protein